MYCRHTILSVFLSIFFYFSSAQATLDLELTQGMSAALPIAIVPFTGASVEASGNQSIPDIIKNDLQNSGQFRVVNGGNLSQDNQQANNNYWRKKGVNDVVTGNIQSLGGNRYQVTFTLINVFDNSDNTSSANNHILLSQTFRVETNGLRNVAHRISDLIYEKLTGVRGIFSTKIAYVLVQPQPNRHSRYSLMVSDADGFNPRPLLTSPEPIMSPSWSPSGREVAYVSFEGHRASIYLQNVLTGSRHKMSEAPGINGAPAFSPDGRQLALVLSKTGNPNIYLLSLGGGQLRQITNDWSIDTEPSFSADGKSIIFTSNRDGTPQIYTYSLSNGAVTRLTYQGDYNARASFMPDSRSIIMMHREGGLFGIARQDLSTGQVDILTQSGVDESPSLAPNGKMVIYATEYGRRGVLAQVSTDGRIKLRLPGNDGIVQEPAWSPFLTN